MSCFRQRVDFKYPQTRDKFNIHLTFFQRKRRLSWTTFWDLLINLTTLPIFWPCHKNLTLLGYTFFIQCILRDLTGKWYCHRQRSLILLQGPYKRLWSLKFCLLTVTGTLTNMNTFLTETFGWIEFTLKSQILLKKIAWWSI